MVKYAAEFGIEAKTISDLPKPPAVQESLAFQSEGQDATGTDQKEVAPPPVGPREAATEILKIPPQPKPPRAKRKTNKMKEKTPGQKEG